MTAVVVEKPVLGLLYATGHCTALLLPPVWTGGDALHCVPSDQPGHAAPHRPAGDRAELPERAGANPSSDRQTRCRPHSGPQPEARRRAHRSANGAADRRARAPLEARGNPRDHRDRERPEADGVGTEPCSLIR